IVTPAQLAAYFAEEAKPWEALTYLKLRHVAGEQDVAKRALEAVRRGIVEVAARPDFEPELNEVRTRLERSDSAPTFKTGPGGTYDLDYLAGTLQAHHQLWLAGNLRDRLQLLRDHDLLERADYQRLADAALLWRVLGTDGGFDPEMRLAEVLRDTRAIYRQCGMP